MILQVWQFWAIVSICGFVGGYEIIKDIVKGIRS